MKRTLIVSSIVIVIAFILTFIWMGYSVYEMSPDSDQPAKPIVLVSVEPYADMVERIAGDTVTVTSVIPAHVDPHNWEPTYKDMSKLKGAKVWFTIGEGFESSLAKKLKEVDPNLVIFNLNDKVKTLADPSPEHGHHHEFDTHTWLSPPLLEVQARFVTQILSDLEPNNDDMYKTNYLKLENELKQLNKDCAKTLLPYKGDIIVTTHGAFTYYCNDYGLEQVIIEPSSGKDPRMRDITELIKQLRRDKKRIIGIFLQPQHPNKAAQIIAGDLKIPTYMIDPYAPDFMATIRRMTLIITASAAEGDPT